MGIALHHARHGLICHEDQDETIGASLRLYGEWAEEEIYFLSSFIDPGAIVLDIGANVGTHALAFSRFATAHGLVIAIDAQERMNDLLVLAVALNGADNVRCIRALVGRETGVRFVPPDNNQSTKNFGAVSYLSSPALTNGPIALVPLSMIRLDDFALQRCDLMKIDVEGMELDVLFGAAETIARHRPPIYFEQAREDRFTEAFEFFRLADYSLYWHSADPFNRNNFYQHSENIFGGTRELNVFATPNEKAERYRRQTSRLQPILRPIYEPPPRQGPATGWALPDRAYEHLDPVTSGPLAKLIAEKICAV